MGESILAKRHAVRQQGLSTGTTTIGKAVFHTVDRRGEKRDFNINQLQLREIEAVIRSRHGLIVPDPGQSDDRDTCLAYAIAVASALAGQKLRPWANRWMPWATTDELDDIGRSVSWQDYMLNADGAAHLLFVTLAERNRLGLKTIGACDVTKAERQEVAREAKRQRDRERKAEQRRGAGRTDRATYEAQSLSATKPWEIEGISRRTWERRRARDASLSRVEVSNTIGATLATTVGGGRLNAPSTNVSADYLMERAELVTPAAPAPTARSGVGNAGTERTDSKTAVKAA